MKPHGTTLTLDEAIRSAVREELAQALPDMIAELRPQSSAAPSKRLLTINDLRKHYGIGRGQLVQLIEGGRLPATRSIMRGGREGWRVRVEDAERVLAGS
jgi:hypothetical protein